MHFIDRRGRVWRLIRRPLFALTASGLLATASAQAPRNGTSAPPGDSVALHVTTNFAGDQYVSGRAPLSLTFDHSVLPADGNVVVLLGSTDVTGLFERTPSALVRRATNVALPAGEQEMSVYLVRGERWDQIGRFPVKILTAGGFAKAEVTPGLSLTNKGQVAEGHSGSAAAPDRSTFQDLGMSASLKSVHATPTWSVQSQSNFVGASRQQEALRYGLRGKEAPRVDLADYTVRIEGGPLTVGLGQLSVGANRHLINNYSSRGVTTAVSGKRGSLTLASMSGASIVGWENPLGLQDAHHRVTSAALGVEMLPDRPGMFRMDASLLDASRRPTSSFTQGAIVDAEENRGGGLNISMSTPSQRVRVVAGLTRSRFGNPTSKALDPQLVGDTVLVPSKRETRDARFAEANVGLIQNLRLAGATSNLTAAYRHERIDPLFRSVAATTRADQQQHTFELSGNIGALGIQQSLGRNNDNLAAIPSIMTTRNRSGGTQLSLPVSVLVHGGASLWPTLTAAFNQQHSLADQLPTNGDFSASHLPNQLTTTRDAAAQWQGSAWRLGYHFNHTFQDNRQVGRELSDFRATAHSVSLSVTPRPALSLSTEANVENQRNVESASSGDLVRVGVVADWHVTPLTGLQLNVSGTSRHDTPLTSRDRGADAWVQLARAFNLWRSPAGTVAGATRGQAFLRFSQQSGTASRAAQAGGVLLATPRGSWTLTSGFTLGVY